MKFKKVYLLPAAFAGLSAISAITKPSSVYKNHPEDQNPLQGKMVEFIYDDNDPENADGVKGHLEAVGDSKIETTLYNTYIKRVMDVVLSFAGLVVLSPVYAGVSLAIVIDDPGPVFFTQKRLGKDKQYFKLHKFRSMKMSTPHDVPTHMLENPEQYITKVGKFLRKTSLDELPQIWDIFLGNMSVIGPRPGLWNQDLLTAERDKYSVNNYKPGLTGLAQINGRDELEIPDKAKVDGEYISTISIKNDINIFMGSVGVFSGDDNVIEGRTGSIDKGIVETNQSELVSIIMPSYNTGKYISETIQSVINQTYHNWELIIVDDCSTDHSEEIIRTFKDSRIQIFKNDKNVGAANSRNIALSKANGKWIAFLDSDDLWFPDKLEKQIAFMNCHGYHFSYTNYVEIDESGSPNGVFVTGPKKITKQLMYIFNFMGCLTVMYDREFVGLIQIPSLEKRNDYALWLKVSKFCPAYLFDECLAEYRVRFTGSVMNRSKNPLHRMKYNYYLWKYSENLSVLSSLCMTVINLIGGSFKTLVYKKRVGNND